MLKENSNNHKLFIGYYYYMAILFFPTLSASAQVAITASEPELLYATMPCRCDAVSATLKKDSSNLWTFLSSWDRTYKYSGSMDYPWQDNVLIMHSNYYKMFSTYAKQHTAEYAYDFGTKRYHEIRNGSDRINLYLKNVHKIGSNELLGFLHVEYTFQDGVNPYPAYYSIALCHSTNNGDHWTFCGDIIRTNNIRADNRCNIGGAAYVIKDGNYYIYFNEVDQNYEKFPSVACADTGAVNIAARNGQVTEWKKFNSSGNWNIVACSSNPGLGSRIIPESIMPFPDMHADAAYCNYLKKYLLAMKSSNNLYILSSTDGINWNNPQLVAQYNNSTGRIPSYPYFASLSSDANEDCSIVGKQFSVYYINMLYEPTSGNNLSLFRIKMMVHDKPL
jgi:hypothetical protein